MCFDQTQIIQGATPSDGDDIHQSVTQGDAGEIDLDFMIHEKI